MMTPDKYNFHQLSTGFITVGTITSLTRLAQRHLGLTEDGKFGPSTADALFGRSDEPLHVKLARLELGNGEETSNNEGPDLDRYRDGGAKGSWCAAFVCFILLNSGFTFVRSHGARRLTKNLKKAGWTESKVPVVGAVALWGRGTSSWMGHTAIVSRVEGDRWWVIEGNVGAFPAKVSEREVSQRPRFISFVIPPQVL